MNQLFSTNISDLTPATSRNWTKQLTSVSLSGTLGRMETSCSFLCGFTVYGDGYCISYSFGALIGVCSSDWALLILVYQ